MSTGRSNRKYNINDVYYAIRTESNFNYGFWLEVILTILFERLIKFCGVFMISAASIIISIVSFIGFFIILPIVASPGSLWFYFNVVWGLTLLFNILFNYVMSVISDPGYCDNNREEISENTRDCKKCNQAKPRRAHHCSVCGKCVKKMDHHCPWINNCVGWGNYRYFLNFLLWTTIATLYLVIITTPKAFEENSILRVAINDFKKTFTIQTFINNLYEAFYYTNEATANPILLSQLNQTINSNNLRGAVKISNQSNSKVDLYSFFRLLYALFDNKSNMRRLSLTTVISDQNIWNIAIGDLSFEEMCIFVMFMICLGVFVAVGCLLTFHLYIVSIGCSTIEFYEAMVIKDRLRRSNNPHNYVNPYDLGYVRNFQQIYGYDYSWYRAILPSFRISPPAIPIDLEPIRYSVAESYDNLMDF